MRARTRRLAGRQHVGEAARHLGLSPSLEMPGGVTTGDDQVTTESAETLPYYYVDRTLDHVHVHKSR